MIGSVVHDVQKDVPARHASSAAADELECQHPGQGHVEIDKGDVTRART